MGLSVSVRLEQAARFTPRAAGMAPVLPVLLLGAALRLSVLAPSDPPAASSRVSAAVGPSGGPHDCPADGHRDTRATGLTPDDIPTLPPDYAFFQVASDSCSPVRWDPCQPVRFVINPANAPPTGVADTREAFKRLAAATGITYIDEGFTDEDGQDSDRAYQPERYGDRWAPILVHWMSTSSTKEDTQVVGGGLPTRVGDVYVSGDLFLNPSAVTNQQTRTTVPGGFGDGRVAIGAIGPEGVTWGRIILHELAHITGLGHVSVPSNLMYPETSDQTGATGFSKDDLAGVRLLGREAGCLETPRPGVRPSPRSG